MTFPESGRVLARHKALKAARVSTVKIHHTVRVVFRKHLVAAVRHPHHYYTASGITVVLAAMRHLIAAEVMTVWVYAFVETVVSGDMVEKLAKFELEEEKLPTLLHRKHKES